MELKLISIDKPEDMNFILGQSHFIKTVEDLHEALVQAVPGIKFGVAFCEASGPSLVRASGTGDDLIELAKNVSASAPDTHSSSSWATASTHSTS
jgi:adenosine/AMP kinase